MKNVATVKRVVLYTRVSTDEQAKRGFSLPYQKEFLESYCKAHGYEVVAHYEEDYSAKNFDRPEWKKLEAFIKKEKKNVDMILCSKWDRFSRNQEQSLAVISRFREWGVEVQACDHIMDYNTPDSKLMLSLMLIMPEIENDKNRLRTKDGMYQAQKEGRSTGSVPFGYKKGEVPGINVIDPVTSEVVVEAFKKMATGAYSAEEVRKMFYPRGLKKSKQTFLNLLRNKYYIGKAKVSEHLGIPEHFVDGLHEPLIDTHTFNNVQAILNGKKKEVLVL